jgi:spore germination protein (amino acid permease)
MDRSLGVCIIYILCQTGLILFLYPADIIDSSSEGQWAAVLLGFVIHFSMIMLLLKGLSLFPDRDMIMIYLNHGKVIASIFLLPLLIYLLIAAVITVRAYSEFVSIVFLSKTPSWAIMGILLILSAYLATKSIDGILRTGVILFFLLVPVLCFILIISFQNVDWRYVYPLDTDFSFIKHPSYLNSFFAIGGLFFFLGFVQPDISIKKNTILLSALSILPIFIISVYVPVLTFGQDTASHFRFPYVMAVDAINLTWFMFDRLTMFFLLSVIIFSMLYLSLVLWMMVRLIGKSSRERMMPQLVLMGLVLTIYSVCFFITDWSTVEMFFRWNTPLRIFILFGIPLSIYLLGVRARKKEATGSA